MICAMHQRTKMIAVRRLVKECFVFMDKGVSLKLSAINFDVENASHAG